MDAFKEPVTADYRLILRVHCENRGIVAKIKWQGSSDRQMANGANDAVDQGVFAGWGQGLDVSSSRLPEKVK